MIGVAEVPVWMISCEMRLAVLIGIANPRPILPAWPSAPVFNDAIAELTPITCPSAFTNGPPEFPGLIGASVWMALMKDVSPLPDPPAVTGRSRELTIPLVTVPSRPSGEPMAITWSPTFTLAESPTASGVRPVLSIFTTARS